MAKLPQVAPRASPEPSGACQRKTRNRTGAESSGGMLGNAVQRGRSLPQNGRAARIGWGRETVIKPRTQWLRQENPLPGRQLEQAARWAQSSGALGIFSGGYRPGRTLLPP